MKPKKAIGYVCEIPIPGTDMVISRDDQLARIYKYAAREGIELVAVYGDAKWTEDFATRPGVQKMLAGRDRVNCVLVDRVWALSRKMAELKPLIEELEAKGAELVSASYLWDCVSQQVRHRYMGTLAGKQRAAARVAAGQRHAPVAA